MTTIRTFIAIELSDEARVALADLQNRLKAVVPPRSVRWTAAPNVHLTLHFLGDVAVSDVKKITEAMNVAAMASQPLSLTLAGLGCFPNMRRPRIVWTGVSGDITALVKLHRELGDALKVVNFSPETRPYSPHLTIGRVNKRIQPRHLTLLGEVLEKDQAGVGQLARLAVTEVSLMKSDLKPSGPVYTRLAAAPLRIVD